MIIEYDTRPNATIDEKIRSLIDSIMLAFNEAGFSTDTKVLTETENRDADVSTLEALIRQLSGDISSLESTVSGFDTRIEDLESSVSDLGTTVSGHTSDISNLDQRVTALEEAQG